MGVLLQALLWATWVSRYTMSRFDPEDKKALDVEDQSLVLYFSYGANMHAGYLKKVRKVNTAHSHPARLNGFRICFTVKGPNFIEPGFANIAPCTESFVEGVLHTITATDLGSIIASEPREYSLKTVSVISPKGEVIKARTLISSAADKEYHPSKRYLNLLITAARTSGLSADYIALLQRRSVYYPVLSELMGWVIKIMVKIKSAKD